MKCSLKNLIVMNRDDLIQYIIKHDPKAIKEKLEHLSLEALVMLKVQLEIIDAKNGRAYKTKSC